MKRILKFPLIFLLVLFAVFYALRPLWVKPARIERALMEQLEEMTAGEVSMREIHFSFFPRLRAELKGVKILCPPQSMAGPPSSVAEKNRTQIFLGAEKVTIYLRSLPLLWGKMVLAGFEIQNGDAGVELESRFPLETVRLSRMRIRMGSFGARKRIPVSLEADLEGVPKSLSGKGSFTLAQTEKWDWKSFALEGELRVQDFALDQLPLRSTEDVRIQSGQASGHVQFSKKKGEGELKMKGKADVKGLVYHIPDQANLLHSPEIPSQIEFDLSWNPESEAVMIWPSVWRSPIGTIEVTGNAHLGTGELREMRIAARGLALENVPHTWIPLKEAIPFNVGFSGTCDLEMSLTGTADHLTLHANWDLTPALFTYARYFTKPKDHPLNLTFDFLLKEGKILTGDFSLRLKETTAKGTMTDVNLRTGQGQINVITNKFQLAGWEELLLPFKHYEMKGETKFLVNFSGNIRKLHEAQMMLNWTLEGGSFKAPSGAEVHDVYISSDYGPLMLVLKETRFEVGDTAIYIDLTVDNPALAPRAVARISSAHFEPVQISSTLRQFAAPWTEASVIQTWQEAEKTLLDLFPKGQTVENFFAEIQHADRKWLVKNFVLEAYDGRGQIQAGADVTSEERSLWLDAEIDHMSLARFLNRAGGKPKLVDGNFFLKGRFRRNDFSAPWQKTLMGEGSFSITNGEFHTFDLLGAISKTAEFSSLTPHATGATRFDDLRSSFVLKEERVATEKVTLMSRDLTVEAAGDMSLGGTLNFRLDTYLSNFLTQAILKEIWGKPEGDENAQLGPISFLLAGPLANPELRPDATLLPQLVDSLFKKKTQKILRNFPPEEDFLDRRKSA